jgi:hypothetical protein
MSFIAFPLRFQNGFLLRAGEAESVLALIKLMAATPGGSWAGGSHFGVRDIFESARMQPDAVKIATERINRALIDLGITAYRVERTSKEPSTSRDVDVYVVTIISTVDESRTYSVTLNS